MTDPKIALFVRIDKPLKDYIEARSKQFGSLKNYLLKLAIEDGYQQNKID